MSDYQTGQTIAALCVWREAMGEGGEGMLAVAWVLSNRLTAHFMGAKTLLDVVTATNQFSSMTVRGDLMTTKWPNAHCTEQELSTWASAQQAVRLADAGLGGDPTHGALYYANLKNTTSGWFIQNIVDDPEAHPQTARIGNHTFYR